MKKLIPLTLLAPLALAACNVTLPDDVQKYADQAREAVEKAVENREPTPDCFPGEPDCEWNEE